MKIIERGSIAVLYHGTCDKCGVESEYDYDEVQHYWGAEPTHTARCRTVDCDEIVLVDQIEKSDAE